MDSLNLITGSFPEMLESPRVLGGWIILLLELIVGRAWPCLSAACWKLLSEKCQLGPDKRVGGREALFQSVSMELFETCC